MKAAKTTAGITCAFLAIIPIPNEAAVAAPSDAAFPPGIAFEVPLAAHVPADARAAIVNLTVAGPLDAGYVTAYACGDPVPNVSNVNFAAGDDAAGSAMVELSASGTICVVSSAWADVIVDLQGYVPAGSPVQLLDAPVRAVDTRHGMGVAKERLAAGSRLEVRAGSVAGVPSDAAALVVTVTSVDPDAPGFVTAAPCLSPSPSSSTLNVIPGRAVANMAVAGTDAEGSSCFTASVATDLLIDVTGYVPAGVAGIDLLPAPRRLLDTRNGVGSVAQPVGAAERPIDLTGVGDVPPGAVAVIANVTASRASAAGFVTLAPCGSPPAQVSNLNVREGADVANAVVVDLTGMTSPAAAACVTASTSVDVLVDVVGFVTDPGALVTMSPTRVYDSRAVATPSCGLALAHPAPTTFWVIDVNTGGLAHVITSERFSDASLARFPLIFAQLLPTCDGLVVWNPIPPYTGLAWEVLRVGFDGTVTVVRDHDLGRSRLVFPDVVASFDGSDTWVDVATGAPVFRMPEGTGGPSQVSNGGWILSATSSPSGDVRSSLWARREMSDPLFPEAALIAEFPGYGVLSPSGRYLAEANGATVAVRTLSGTPVASADLSAVYPTATSATNLHLEWVDDGTLIACAPGLPVRNVLWSISSTPVVLDHAACVLDAR
jgi:hypothetical protein